MIIYPLRLIAGALLLAFVEPSTIRTDLTAVAYAHESHQSFAAGEPGDPKKLARTIKVVMREDGKKMAFEPARITPTGTSVVASGHRALSGIQPPSVQVTVNVWPWR